MYKYLVMMLLPLSLWANSIQFQSISHEGCLYGVLEEQLLVASFNDGKAYKFSKKMLDNTVQKYEQELGESVERVETMIHCGAYGSSLVLNLKVQEKGLCLWMKYNSENRPQIIDIGLLDGDSSGTCHGMRPGVLFINFLEELTKSQVETLLKEMGLFESMLDVSSISKKLFKIKLVKKLDYDVFSLIESIKSKNHPQIKSIEGEYLYHPVGDFRSVDWN